MARTGPYLEQVETSVQTDRQDLADPHGVRYNVSIAVLVIAAPILFTLIKATQSRGDVLSPSLLPEREFISNLEIVWTDQNLGRYMANSRWIAFSVTVGETVLSILAAMVLVYFHVRFKAFIFGFILFTLLMPTEVLLIVPFMASATGIFLFRQHFMSIPRNLGDAARIVQVGLNLIIGVGERVYWGQVMASALVSILPPLIVFIALQEQFMRGFALTSDK